MTKIIFFPGFPGDAIPRLAGEIRVYDIVEEIAKEQKVKIEKIIYPGIMDERTFSFDSSFNTSLEVAARLSENNDILIGHSWGGLLALLITMKLKISQTILINPLLYMDEKDVFLNLTHLSTQYPRILTDGMLTQNQQDVLKFLSMVHRENILSQCDCILSLRDEVIDYKKIKSIAESLGINTTLCDSDHNFTYNQNLIRDWIKQVVSKQVLA